MPTRTKGDTSGKANGISVRGVVVEVYSYDSTAGYAAGKGTDANPINTIYVDVMCYGKFNGRIARVLWTYDRSGLHDGPVMTPRPATFDIQGTFNVDHGSNPAGWDGDHVIVSFLEDDLGQPYVSRCMPHPSSDRGNSELAVGHRMRIKSTDGRTRLWKHQGAVFGADKAGNWLVDLRRAHTGEYLADGLEPAQKLDGSVGNYNVLVPEGSKFKVAITKSDQTVDSQSANPDDNTTSVEVENNKLTVKIDGGVPLTLVCEGGAWTLTNTGDTTLDTDGKVHLGTGAAHPIIHGDTYQTDQTAKNTPVAAHLTGIAAASAALAGTVAPAEIATIPGLWAAILAFAAGLGVTGATAGSAVSAFDSAVAAQLSADVDSK